MFVLRIWNYLRGYVIFRLEGLNLERVLNLAIERNVYIWHIQRINYTTIEAKVGLNDYGKIKELLDKTGCQGKIYVKIGWPFFISRLKRRKMIIAGFFIFILLIAVFSSFIWTVDVKCNNYILEKDILIYLNKIGVHPGVFKYNLNRKIIQDDLMVKYDKIAWTGIEIKGTKAIVSIIEKDRQPSNLNDNVPCDILASKTAVIEKIIPENGDAVVKKGDVVKPNQLLISGTIKRDEVILRYVHSMGTVFGRTLYEKIDKISLNKTIKVKTGHKHSRKVLKFGNTSLSIGSEKIPFDKYILESKNKSFIIWRNLKSPVEIVFEEYYEIEEKELNLPLDDIKDSLGEKLMIELISEIPRDAEILNKSITYEENNNHIIGKLTVEVIEAIGVKRKIQIPENVEINEEDTENN